MAKTQGAKFLKKMKKTHKIWLPDMLHYHNELLQAAFLGCGYQLEILPECRRISDYSQPYISGDYCLPIFLILGQMLALLQSGDCDVARTAFMEPQTGGACRAGNYYNSIIESLKKAGYPQIPVISLNAFGKERHPGFFITPRLLFGAVAAVCYGDLLMTLVQQVRPYERTKGQAETCRQKWMRFLADEIKRGKSISSRKRRERYQEMIKDFKEIPVQKKDLRKVGIAGEVYMKYSPVGNEHLEDYLQREGCDYRMGGFVNYAIYIVDSEYSKMRLQGFSKWQQEVCFRILCYLKRLQEDLNDAVACSMVFQADAGFDSLKEKASAIIDCSCNEGDGWLIAGEVADLVSQGYDHILVLHPFGCLVSHVCIRGILKKLREKFPGINIQAIEYDYDSSKTLRESRILLGLSDFL